MIAGALTLLPLKSQIYLNQFKEYIMKPSRLVDTLIRLQAARLIPFIKGSPGLGKSAMVKQLAKKYNLKLIDIRLGQVDPTDLNACY